MINSFPLPPLGLRSGSSVHWKGLSSPSSPSAGPVFAPLRARTFTAPASPPIPPWPGAIIQSIPGPGPVTAASLCAALPELGTLGRRKAAALLGLALFDRDSG